MLNNPYADNHYTLVQPLGICPRWSRRESEYCEIISECALPELPERFENGPFFFFCCSFKRIQPQQPYKWMSIQRIKVSYMMSSS